MFPTSHSPEGAWTKGRAGRREVGSPDLGGDEPAGWAGEAPDTHWPSSHGPATSAQRLESPPGSCSGVWEGFEQETDGF